MPDFEKVFTGLYAARMTRDCIFRRAVLSGSAASYPTDRALPVGVRYRQVGFDPIRGVIYPRNVVEVLIWFRDWFSRPTDGATNAELAQMIADFRGDVVDGSREHWSRFLLDGQTLKYDSHALDQRPDGVVFAAIVTLQAA